MGKARNILGQKFNRLTVIKKLDEKHKNGGFMWLCKCDCGNEIKAPTYRITSGEIPSCGCQKKEGQKKKRAFKPRVSFENFITKFGNKWSLSCDNWIGVIDSFIKISCPEHGETNRKASQLRQVDIPCIECANKKRALNKTNSYKNVIERFKSIYGEKYIYPESNNNVYENQYSTIKIICPIHGTFDKNVQKHLSGQGCFECKVQEMIDENILIGGYNSTILERNPEIAKSNGFIYYLEIGEYYKIGITRTSVNDRVKKLRSDSKLNVKVLDVVKMPLIDAYTLEQSILKLFKLNRLNTDWSTEIFDSDVLNGVIPRN